MPRRRGTFLPLASADLSGGFVAELWSRAPYESREAGVSGVIGFAFEEQEGEDAIASDHVRAFRRRANTVAWIPPGCPAYSASRVGGEYLVLRGFAAEAIGHPDAFGRTVSDVVEAAAVSAAQELRRGLLGTWSNVASSVAVDVLRAALLARFQGKMNRATGWLTPARMATIDKVVSERIGVRTDVADVAAELGLSVGFLVLAFRTALGTTPHRYIMERRLAYARMELTTPEKGIATIASEAGFADQAHLTRYMRAKLGMTPGAYRRLRRT